MSGEGKKDKKEKKVSVAPKRASGPTGTLNITRLTGTNVCPKPKKLFCVLWVGVDETQKWNTTKAKKATSPKWEEEEWNVRLTGQSTISVRLFDDSKKWLGSCEMPLSKAFLSEGKTVHLDCPLGSSDSGGEKKKGKLAVQGSITITCDFIADAWQQFAPMAKRRMGHTVSLLPNGHVLIVGGCDKKYGLSTGHCEVVNPATPADRVVHLLKYARCYHAATRLKNGNILISGGIAQENTNDVGFTFCEIFTGKGFVDAAPMKHRRLRHSAVLLQDGSVLVTGGLQGDIAIFEPEIYDPRTNKWYDVAVPEKAMFGHQTLLLPNGKVLVVGGAASRTPGELSPNSYIYDPSVDKWFFGPEIPQSYLRHQMHLMSDGTVMLMPGSDWWASHTPNKSQHYTTDVLYWSPVGDYDPSNTLQSLGTVRCSCGASARLRGDVIVYFGGFTTAKGSSNVCNYFEFYKYNPNIAGNQKYDGAWYTLDPLLVTLVDAELEVLDGGRQVIICGGLAENGVDAMDTILTFNYNCTKTGRLVPGPDSNDIPTTTQIVRAKVIPVTIRAAAFERGEISDEDVEIKHLTSSSTSEEQAPISEEEEVEEEVWEEEEEESSDGLQSAAIAAAEVAEKRRQELAEAERKRRLEEEAALLMAEILPQKSNVITGTGLVTLATAPDMLGFETYGQKEDPKVTRAKEGLRNTVQEIRTTLQMMQMQSSMANITQLAIIITWSRTLKAVKMELWRATEAGIQLVDSPISTPQTQDKLMFAQLYLQSEIQAIDMLLTAIVSGLNVIFSAPPLMLLLKCMMEVKRLLS